MPLVGLWTEKKVNPTQYGWTWDTVCTMENADIRTVGVDLRCGESQRHLDGSSRLHRIYHIEIIINVRRRRFTCLSSMMFVIRTTYLRPNVHPPTRF